MIYMIGKQLLLGLVGGEVFAVSGAASATFVSFSGFSDSSPGNFDAAATAAGAADGLVLDIALDDFAARAGIFNILVDADVTFDDLQFTVNAADGYRITGVRSIGQYSAAGIAGGFATAAGSVAIAGVGAAGVPGVFLGPGAFSTSGPLGPVDFDMSSEVHESLTMVLSYTLVAFFDAEMVLNSARVEFTVAPVPLPPALLLFGSGVMSMVVVGRRRRSAA
jgi:hypothetical protein